MSIVCRTFFLAVLLIFNLRAASGFSPPLTTSTCRDYSLLLRSAASSAEEALQANDALLAGASRLIGDRRRRGAVVAVYAWCRRADDVADDGGVSRLDRLERLQEMESDLESAFRGEPLNELDGRLLSEGFSEFPLELAPFRSMLDGMRTDLSTDGLRFARWDPDLRLYCEQVAGTVGMMLLPILLNEEPDDDDVREAAVDLGVAIQLTNILRDVGSDVTELQRIYLPLEDLAGCGCDETDVLELRMTAEYVACLQIQVSRARELYASARVGARKLPAVSRFAVFAIIRLLSAIIDELEARDYDNLTGKVRISTTAKINALGVATADFFSSSSSGSRDNK